MDIKKAMKGKQMTNKVNIITLLSVLIISSCSWKGIRDQLGVSSNSPDEFLIDKRDSLVIPKELRSLPTPGDATNTKNSSYTKAKSLMFGEGFGEGTGNNDNSIQGLNSFDKEFLKKAEADNISNRNIRETIEDDFKNERSIFGLKKGSTLESIVDPFGYNRAKTKVIDGNKENERIRKEISRNNRVENDEVIIVDEW